MENWREDALSGHTHDPNEVTVQIDGLGRLRAEHALSADGGQESDKPVFVDESGSRGRTVRRIGLLMGVVCAVYAVVLVLTLASGSSDAPWMPGLGDDANSSGKVKPSPTPTGPASPTAGSGAPLAPDETARTQDPLPTTRPTGGPDNRPTATGKPTEKPTEGGGTEPDADPTATDPGTDPQPTTEEPTGGTDPQPTEPDPGTEPTETEDPATGGQGGGAGGTAGGGDKPASADSDGSGTAPYTPLSADSGSASGSAQDAGDTESHLLLAGAAQ